MYYMHFIVCTTHYTYTVNPPHTVYVVYQTLRSTCPLFKRFLKGGVFPWLVSKTIN